jgi:hypothetical protein
VGCKFRRKGSSTWRELDHRPSFKIKKLDYNEPLEIFPCKGSGRPDSADAVSCNALGNGSLAGTTQNEWDSDKVTFNNRILGWGSEIGGNDVAAYNAFRDAGAIAPLAKYVTIRLFRDETERVGPYIYSMIETISDKKFMRKYFSRDHVLWEVDSDIIEYKRSGGTFDETYENKEANGFDCGDANCSDDVCTPQHLLALGVANMTIDSIASYWVGSLRSKHWDDSCSGIHPFLHNLFIVKAGGTYTWIPHGAEDTFGCGPAIDAKAPSCIPAIECMEMPSCSAIVDQKLEEDGPWSRECGIPTYVIITITSVILITVILVWWNRKPAKKEQPLIL